MLQAKSFALVVLTALYCWSYGLASEVAIDIPAALASLPATTSDSSVGKLIKHEPTRNASPTSLCSSLTKGWRSLRKSVRYALAATVGLLATAAIIGGSIAGALTSNHSTEPVWPCLNQPQLTHPSWGNSSAGVLVKTEAIFEAEDSSFELYADPSLSPLYVDSCGVSYFVRVDRSQVKADTDPWLRLKRDASGLSAAISTDGMSWTEVARKALDFSDQVFVGLAVASGHPNKMQSTEFDVVSLQD